MKTKLLKKAINVHRKGDLSQAESLYKNLLERYPRDHNILQLLGAVFYAQAKFESAVKVMGQSLQIKPEQPLVLMNFAICQRHLRHFAGAEETIEKLLAIEPSNIEAFKLKVDVLIDTGREQQAYAMLQNNISKINSNYNLLSRYGSVASAVKDYATAINAYNKALEIKPNSLVVRHNLGLAYRLYGDSKSAIKHYHTALELGKPSYQLMHNMGNAHSDIGELSESIYYYQKALALNFAYLETHINLNDVIWETGNKHNYLISLVEAIRLYPDEPAFLYEYARRLFRLSEFDRMKQALSKKTSKFGSFSEFKYLLAKIEFNVGDKTVALLEFERLSKAKDLSFEDRLDICEMLIKEGNIELAEESIQQILLSEPSNIAALSYWALCLRYREDPREQKLNDYNNLVQEFTLFDPNVELDFYRDLVSSLNDMHSANEQPINQTLMNGTQTRGLLFSSDIAAIKELKERIEKCIRDYIENAKSLESPWLQLPVFEKLHFVGSWSVKLKKGGFHSNHFHPMGRLSSVVYIDLPNCVDGPSKNEGYLKFGEPNFSGAFSFEPKRYLRPEIGKLILFPSYFWHGTVPFDDEKHRLTVAFDVI